MNVGKDLGVMDSRRPSQGESDPSTRETCNKEFDLQHPHESGTALPWQANPTTWQFLRVGPHAETLLGYPLAEWYEPDFWVSHVHPEDQERAAGLRRKSVAGSTGFAFEYRMVSASGKVVWIHDVGWVDQLDDASKTLRGAMVDITISKRAVLLQAGISAVLELLARGTPLAEVMVRLAGTIDAQQTGMRSSILQLDSGGVRLRHLAGPNLPDGYNDSIDGIRIGPNVGSCGTAAWRHERIIVTDIMADPLWTNYRDLAARFGLRACWSQPIKSRDGRVLGTFAMYYDHPRHPSDAELRLIEEASHLAGLALEHTAALETLRKGEAALRETHEQLQHLTGRLLTAQEDERRRLARELHDDLAQRMAAVAIETGKLEQQAGIVPEPVRDGLSRIQRRIVDLSEDLHDMSRRLHPSILQDLGLVDAIQSECASFSEREAIRIEFTAKGEIPVLPLDVALCLYRVLQEGLRNVAKHSQARDGRVRLDGSDSLVVLTIEDSGVGFDPSVTKGVAGLGLVSMKERVRLIRGEFNVQSRSGSGTVIEARAPVPQG